ncbi:MAG TPA: nucleotide sugar dehydrogenase, partial [Saprospirales bacterium]|nr:nucleotide sugar dehydrogenase [Saprospirales bacterium]
ATEDKIVVEKSTLPVKTAQAIKSILDNVGNGVKFQILSNPEFLAEGTAINDLHFADRVLIGGDYLTEDGKAAMNALTEIYSHWIPKEKIIHTNVWSSELSKLTANAFLAQRVSSINSISVLCEETGADAEEVAKAIGSDSRIGDKFLKVSVGFGGSCFQKDILNLVYICRSLNLHDVADYWEHVIKMNDHQKHRFAEKIINTLYNTVSGKKITFLGWAFKKDTNDTRESAAIYVAWELLMDNAEIHVFDPKVTKSQMIKDLNYLAEQNLEFLSIKDQLLSKLVVHTDPYAAMKEAHAIAVLTEWDEFRTYDWERVYNNMIKPAFVFDGRNILNAKQLFQLGFRVFQIGKKLN